ncbi:DotU family type IV/VI secretion system protein [Dongshaea marina]|uniref:DotU family type IV/VI secretion system protein n=1 Tax=Dongshaea marina TaxID=2047966 RepID=UPI000D3E56CF|nr:DotU family type IV/VI secretion system protein [Dongshaea marina]
MVLLGIYQPFMAAVSLVAEGKCQLESTAIGDWLEELREQTSAQIGRLRGASEWQGDADFAVYAWADEMLLLSEWGVAQGWQPLQMRFFGTNCAGEEFFVRLDSLLAGHRKQQTNPAQLAVVTDLLSIYGACLASGFKGRFYHEGEAHLQQVRNEINECLGYEESEVLFDVLHDNPTSSRKRIKAWHWIDPLGIALIIGALIGTLVVFLVYHDLLVTELLNWPA